MKRFRFSLESVLKLRKDQEEVAERALAGARQALAAAERRCENAQEELSECWAHSRSAMHSGAPVCQFEQARRYAATVQEKIQTLEVKRKQAADAADKALARLRGERQRREVLDNLRERRFVAFRTQENAREQRETDECSTAAYARGCAGRSVEAA